MRIRVLIILAICLFLLQSFAGNHARTHAAAPAGYHVINKVTLGGDGGWDCLVVDSKARRIYISRSTHVMVVDMETEKVVGDIPKTNGVHDIAVVPDLGKGFISNGRDNSVSVFDLKTLVVSKQIPVGKNPDVIIYDPASKQMKWLTAPPTDEPGAAFIAWTGDRLIWVADASALGDESAILEFVPTDPSEVLHIP